MTALDKLLDVGRDPDAPALKAWLRSVVGLVDPLAISVISGGWSNITSLVTDGRGRQVALRRPPVGHDLGDGAHDVLREALIVAALRDSAVPVPEVVGQCVDLTVVGAPFYATEFLAGTVVRSAEVAREVAEPLRHGLGLALVDVLADIQAVDLDQVGLGGLRRTTPYLQRQLRRWSGQWAASATRKVSSVDRATELLTSALAEVEPVPEVLVHGDYRFGNIMIDSVRQPRIAAVLDWELTSTGHPLADLGALGARMQAPPEVLEAGVDPSAVDGFPSLTELAEHFHHRTGGSVADLPVFVAFSAWRWAIIVEGIQRRLSRGAMADGMGDGPSGSPAWHRRRVELLADFAVDRLS